MGIRAKVNLDIFLTHILGGIYQRPDKKDMLNFQKYLISRGVLCTIRESKGLDISAACGQLRDK